MKVRMLLLLLPLPPLLLPLPPLLLLLRRVRRHHPLHSHRHHRRARARAAPVLARRRQRPIQQWSQPTVEHR